MNSGREVKPSLLFLLTGIAAALLSMETLGAIANLGDGTNVRCIPNAGGGGSCPPCEQTASEVGIGCAWMRITSGNMHPGTSSKKGFFSVGGETLSAAMYSPQNLVYAAGYAVRGFSADRTASGVPRNIYLVDPRGIRVGFRFEDGQSIAAPYFSDEKTMLARVLMTDAEGWSTTNNPAYYDLYPGDGDLYRFAAATNSADYLQLVLHRTWAGREETLADIDTELIRDQDGALRQVLAPTRFCDVVVSNDHKYSINMYRRADVQGGKNGSGLYVPQSNAAPLEVWTLENPEPATLKKLKVSQAIGDRTNVFDYTYVAASEEWTLDSGAGLKSESKETAWNDTRTLRNITTTVKDPDGRLVRRTLEKVQEFGWGPGVVEALDDPDGAALKTTYSYSGVGDTTARQNPDGSWVYYTYNANRYLVTETHGYKDAAMGATNEARVVTFDYAPVDPADTFSSSFNDKRPRTITETIKGVTVSKTYNAYFTNSVRELIHIEERCSAPAAYGAAGNLRTVTTYYGTNEPAFHVGLLKSIQHPDGRLDTYDYESGDYTVSTNPAACCFAPDVNGEAWRETITHGTTNSPAGIAGKTTRAVRVLDASSQEVLSEVYAYTGTNYVRVSWTVQQFNDFYKPEKTYRSTGEEEDAVWAACGCTKQSETDAAGIEKTYGVDLLNRVTSVTKSGPENLTTSYTFDAAGRRLSETITGGTGANVISLLVSSNAYDLAGRLLYSVDSLRLTNRYSYQNGSRISTVVRPGGLTNVTENYLDGRAKCTRENGIIKIWQDYGANQDGSQWTLTFTGPAGTNSPMWTKTTTDLLGRTIREEKPAFGGGAITNEFLYNAIGQLVKTTSPGVADTAYAFDELGRQIRQGRIEGGITNWLSGSEQAYETVGSAVWQVSRSLVFPADNDTAVTTAVQRVRLTGLGSSGDSGILTALTEASDIRGNTTTSRNYVNRAAKTVTQAVEYPDSTNTAVNVSSNGLLRTTLSKTGVSTAFLYDALERQVEVRTDSAGGTRSVASVTAYNSKGQVAYTEDAASNRTWLSYDPDTGRQVSMTNAVGDATYMQYDVQGRVTNTWGATYPVAYVFDDFGRMTAMHTWRQEGGSPDVTRWLYDPATGLLTNKVYADGKGPSYSYTADGKVATRIWARGVTTEYSYAECCGAMTNIHYSDDTPAVSFTLDRLGRQVTVMDGTGSRTFTYNDFLQLAAETNVFGAITRAYDSFGRSSGFDLADASYSVRYSYSDVGRFASVASVLAGQSNTWAYAYLPGSDLVQSWTPATSGVTFSRSYEANRDLLTSVTNVAGGLLVSAFDYQNDALGRRTQRIDAGSAVATNLFGYDARSQLTNAMLNGSAFDWTFDPIGNRQTDTSNSVTHVYAANALNQYTTITNGGIRTLTYDLDGNLTNDERFVYAWDAENRLTVARNSSTKLTFAYDYMGRRVSKKVYAYSGAWLLTSDSSFLYDGWNLAREMVIAGESAITNFYCWGADLSGSLQGAGGIGGLLAVLRDGVPYYPCYDANGNITEYVDASGTVVVHREYDAYGAAVVATGRLKGALSFWFSSKSLDAETGLYYFGHRYYSTEWGRWPSMDPVGERGGRNLYGFVNNEPVGMIDKLGALTLGVTKSELTKGDCGTLSGHGDFTGVDQTVYINNWIIQFVEVEEKNTEAGSATYDKQGTLTSCTCCKPDDWKKSRHFYEAFKIQSNAPGGGIGARDAHNNQSKGAGCKSGEENQTKTAVFFGLLSVTGQGCPQGFTLGGASDPTGAGGCWSNTKPSGWDARTGTPALVVKWGTKSSWDCCPTTQKTVASWF